tara:strand:+ start:339 stop:974 length:636 start_codon:yes stop_codon:yes gene_type:complete
LKSKAKILHQLISDVREKHRLMCVEMREKAIELGKPFVGMRVAFKKPKVKNRTYKILGLELKELSLLPCNSKKRKSTGFLGVRNNASFFGYALSDIQLDFVKMQDEGYDAELLKIERTLHEEFSNKTRIMIYSVGVDLMAEHILGEADVDFYLASKGYKISNLHNSSRHSGKIIGVEYNPFMAEINVKVKCEKTNATHIIDNEEHIVNIWD